MAPASQNLTPANVSVLLPKLNDPDSDLRYMSLNDLYSVLTAASPNFLISDYHTCAKTIECLLKALDDSHGEVQNQAIKCLGALTLKLPADILSPLVEKLSNLKTSHSVDNSIPATALRTFIISFPRPISGVPPSKSTQDAYSAISKVLIPRLVGYVVIPHGLKNQPDPPRGMLEIDLEKGVDSDAIDVLIEVIRCFGPMLQEAEKHALQNIILSILDNDRTSTVIKKKTVVAISMLGVHLSDRLLNSFVSTTIESFRGVHLTLPKRRLLITMVGSLARSIPQRLGPNVKTLAPFILSALSEEDYEEGLEELAEAGAPNPELEEVREAALVALDSFLTLCSQDMRPFTNEAIAAALRYVVYDPNSAMDGEDEAMSGIKGNNGDDDKMNEFNVDENNEDEDFEEEGPMSDDDDVSWKVRRCAAKALYSLISTRSNGDLLESGVLYDQVAPVLINRFKEREENVRLEVLSALTSLIRKTGEGVSLSILDDDHGIDAAVSYTSRSRKRRRGGSDEGILESQEALSSVGASSPAETPSPISGPRADLARLTPIIIREIAKLLKQSSMPTKQAAITVLCQMVLVQQGGLSAHFGAIAGPVIEAVKSSATYAGHASASGGSGASNTGSRLRIEALQLVSAICDTHSSNVLCPYIGEFIPSIIVAVKDKYYKISSEAIHVVESIIRVVTPPRSAGTEQKHISHITLLYDVILERAVTNDVDLEVRQRAIYALGVLLARTSGLNHLQLVSAAKRASALNVLQDRLRNETTRLSAVQAVDVVCASAREKEDLHAAWVRAVTLELGAQLRKADRVLRGTSLGALKNLTANPVALAGLDDKTIHTLATMLLPLVNPNDLNLLGLAMVILARLVSRSPRKVVEEDLRSAICKVVVASLGEVVLDSLLGLVKVIGEQGVGKPLMQSLLRNVGVSGDPSVVGKAIGTLLVSGASTVGVRIDDFISELGSSTDEQRKCLALSVLGEVGLRLACSSPLQPSIFTNHFNSISEQVPRAAAAALGRAGAGNINKYLPVILSTSNVSGSSQYLSLHAIKEILQFASKAKIDISPYSKQIWEKLLIASQGEDNKAVGAECIGRLTIIEPKTFLPLLQNYLQDPVPTVRGMVIQAIRFTFADSDDSFDEVLKPVLIRILTTMLNDLNLENRRLALGALNSAAHNKSNIILPHIAHLLPLVMKESKVRPELVREVQMGPFKHKVDDGLEVRKSAYETLYSLMESAYSRINPVDLFDRVVAGLEDEHEIKVLCNLMLTKLIVLDPEESVRHLDAVAGRFRVILAFKHKENAVKQEVEKANEASKGVLRVTVLLHNAFPTASSTVTNLQGQSWKSYREWVGKEFRAQLMAMEMEVKNQTA